MYIRAVQGNIQAIYENGVCVERPLYGSSRLGRLNGVIAGTTTREYRQTGITEYEVPDHLGNVRAVVGDVRLPTGEVDHTEKYYYYPYGFLREGGSYRYGYNGMQREDAIAGAGNTYDFGARLLSSLYGSWFSIDPLAGKYPSFSPYVAMANNPISFVDPDGRDIKPSKKFLASSYGKLYHELYTNNSVYQKIINQYSVSKSFNLTLNYGDKGVRKGANAWTTTTWTFLRSNPKNIIGASSDQIYAHTPLSRTVEQVVHDKATVFMYERTDLGKVRTIIHEGLHSYLGAKGKAKGDEDHSIFNKYRDMMVEALLEYNADNNLGYTSEQLNEFAYLGTTDSKQFQNYIQGLSAKNETDFDTELINFNQRVSKMEWKLVKVEEIKKEETK